MKTLAYFELVWEFGATAENELRMVTKGELQRQSHFKSKLDLLTGANILREKILVIQSALCQALK